MKRPVHHNSDYQRKRDSSIKNQLSLIQSSCLTMAAEESKNPVRKRLIQLLKDAAAKAVAEEDPWAKHKLQDIPAERVIRHLYVPQTKTWTAEETIVKIEKEPFTHGAMRHCFRMKKMATPPKESSNHRFHSFGWTRASNYVAKAYFVDGKIDTSNEAKDAVRNDITLQYEAAYWSDLFNDKDPPKKIVFIRAYAMEFPDREGQPWLAVERFISGTDSYGVGFTKHNTNAGFVDEDLHRVTPQVFSAFSFYESKGHRLVADVQGVGDLYTDPQVLSSDYRFGDGDLGPRGMALFFKTFRHNTLADSIGVPFFALSKNELKHQAKYEDDNYSLSSNSSWKEQMKDLDKFAQMDMNRSRRQTLLFTPPQEILPDDMKATEKRSNQTEKRSNQQAQTRQDIRSSLKISFSSFRASKMPTLKRTSSDVDEVTQSLALAKQDFKFDNKVFNRKESGEMLNESSARRGGQSKRASLLIRRVSDPMAISRDTKENLGKVHYQLAVLHGLGRFPEVVPMNPIVDDENINNVEAPNHDVGSVLFHLAHAASLKCVAACLALGRVHAGLGSCVSNLLDTIVPIDFDAAKILLRRAMESPHPPSIPKAAAGCFLYQIYLDEKEAGGDLLAETVSDTVFMQLLGEILQLLKEAEEEKQVAESHKKRDTGTTSFVVGDRVEANYFLEGTYYSAVVQSISEDGSEIVVMYDDDGSTENLTRENVRLIIPPNATQTALGGPLSDEEALGAENTDEKMMMETYELRGELAEFKLKAGRKEEAAQLFEEASNEAMDAGKMKKATEWSLKASELME